MRIGIDVRHLAHSPIVGVGIVTREILEALARVASDDDIRIFYNGRNAPPEFLGTLAKTAANIQLVARRGSNRLFDARAMITRRPRIDRLLGGINVLLSPHTLLAPTGDVPRVLVVHDLSFVVHPEFFSPKSRRWHRLMDIRGQARRAAGIIVPSRATARDLQRFWHISSEKIRVIPWGTPQQNGRFADSQIRNIDDVHQVAGLPVRQSAKARYALFVGTVEKRKNVLGIVRAFEIMKRDPALNEVQLVLAGALGWGSKEIKSKIQNSKFNNAIALRGYVDEEEKAELFANASLFVYPSFYEGFGLPVLEAMAEGVPVVTSHGTSLPEVAGSAALLVDPYRCEEIAAAMRAVLTQPDLAVELSRRGKKRAAEFRWESAARQIYSTLREVMGDVR